MSYKIISLNDLRHRKADELDEIVPAMLTVNGEEKYVVAPIDQVLVIGDLHPRLKIKLRAIIARARRGMPKPEKYYPPKKVKLDQDEKLHIRET